MVHGRTLEYLSDYCSAHPGGRCQVTPRWDAIRSALIRTGEIDIGQI